LPAEGGLEAIAAASTNGVNTTKTDKQQQHHVQFKTHRDDVADVQRDPCMQLHWTPQARSCQIMAKDVPHTALPRSAACQDIC